MTIILLYLFGALAVSFMCSVLEAVLLSTPVSFISMMEEKGNKTAPLLMKYKTNVDRPVAAILTLNTVAHTIGAAGVGSESVKVFGEAYFGIISAILTLLILVLSEIIPKTIGASYWRVLAMPSAKTIKVLIVITYPLVWLSELLTKCFSPKIQPLTVSREEVAAMVNVGANEGVFNISENKTIQNFLKLVNVSAKEIMTPFVVVSSVPKDMTLKEFYDDKSLMPYSRIPVYDDQREFIIGYVRRMTVLEKLSQDQFSSIVNEILRPILYFKETDKVSDIWQKMLEHKEHISVITDEYGCMRGIVTMEDVIETMLGVEIVDECDTTEDLQVLAREKFTPSSE
ncbi:CNNM domain-containing protein [uncultured Muribaculum sp.]|uniref:CNNM domain-containing protein n=1 Tax=uncultured Muribaculum sp. TaxID=1918613 RepID=UPI0025982C07|nr:CNNM domain-containing protein [uncultured Muribaculum sp.]